MNVLQPVYHLMDYDTGLRVLMVPGMRVIWDHKDWPPIGWKISDEPIMDGGVALEAIEFVGPAV